MTFPATCAVTQSADSNGTINVRAVYTDANGDALDEFIHSFPPGTPPMDIMGYIREYSRGVMRQHVTPADLPASFSVQIGLDGSLRNLDLL